MNQPNFLQKAAEFFGFSSERLEVMSEAEKTKLEGFGEQMAEAESQIDALTEQVQLSTEALVKVEQESTAKDATIAELENTIEARDQEIQSLNDQLLAAQAKVEELEGVIAQLPGAEVTQTAAERDPQISTEKEDKPKFKTSVDAEAAALFAKLKK